MKVYQVIFNDVPLPKLNPFWETVYLPKQVLFQAENYVDFLEKLDVFILQIDFEFSSYEVDLVNV